MRSSQRNLKIWLKEPWLRMRKAGTTEGQHLEPLHAGPRPGLQGPRLSPDSKLNTSKSILPVHIVPPALVPKTTVISLVSKGRIYHGDESDWIIRTLLGRECPPPPNPAIWKHSPSPLPNNHHRHWTSQSVDGIQSVCELEWGKKEHTKAPTSLSALTSQSMLTVLLLWM